MLNLLLMIYILALLISACLIAGQSLWGSAIRKIAPLGTNISTIELISKIVATPRFWMGAAFYVVGTVLYFMLLSKVKFFSVQITMTGLAIILSVFISHYFFKENVTISSMIGVILVMIGIFLVMQK
jgi:uncharacterized membrane protein